MAAKKLGMDRVPCIELGHLTPAQRRALAIADNQLGLRAGCSVIRIARSVAPSSSAPATVSYA
jgi:ParB-like chromosome segregation protein Spo0J